MPFRGYHSQSAVQESLGCRWRMVQQPTLNPAQPYALVFPASQRQFHQHCAPSALCAISHVRHQLFSRSEWVGTVTIHWAVRYKAEVKSWVIAKGWNVTVCGRNLRSGTKIAHAVGPRLTCQQDNCARPGATRTGTSLSDLVCQVEVAVHGMPLGARE